MLCTEGHGISELLYGSYVIKRKRLFVQKKKKTTKSKKLIYYPLYKEKKKKVFGAFLLQPTIWQLKKPFMCSFSRITLLMSHLTCLNNTRE